MNPMTIREIQEAIGATILGADNKEIFIENIVTDSRQVRAGDLFVPVIGDYFDGHDFIDSSYEKGAICCFTEKKISPPEGKTALLVENTRKSLGTLAKHYKEKFPIPVVAITGSVGKTTTKDMIAGVLMEKFQVLKTEGNYNNDIGLPLTVFRFDKEHELAVLELGMNQFGEIHHLSLIVEPDLAVISNVGIAHVENLGSREGILQAKCEIFDGMEEGSVVIFNGDNDMLQTLEGKIPFTIDWYGLQSRKGVYADHIKENGIDSISADIYTPKGMFSVTIPAPGIHMVENALAAVAVGLRYDLTLEEIKRGLEKFAPGKMRMVKKQTPDGYLLLDDSYNANPVSMEASLDVLSKAAGRKVAILGDMYELGEGTEKMHRQVGQFAASKNIDVIISIGEHSKVLTEEAAVCGCQKTYHFPSQEDFWSEGFSMLEKGDTLLVKGSRGMKMEKTVYQFMGVK